MAVFIVYNKTTSEENKAKAREALKNASVNFLELTGNALSSVVGKEERQELPKLYRKAYEQREDVKMKRQAYNHRPDVVQKRAEYNKNPKTIARKKEQARRKTILLRKIRQSDPELYARTVLNEYEENSQTVGTPTYS